MSNLDEQFLRDLGIADLPEEKKGPLVAGLEEQIENRIGLKMAEGLSDEQLEELDRLTEGGDDAQVKEWLDRYVPGYGEIARGVLEEVKGEILGTKAGVEG